MVRAIYVLRLAAFAAILLPAMAAAQAPPKAHEPILPKDEQLDAKGCAHQQRATVGEGGDLDGRKSDGRSLSDQLAKSDGVICPPPHMDPAIKAPVSRGGPMPVIPPPGSPGGDPNIRPK